MDPLTITGSEMQSFTHLFPTGDSVHSSSFNFSYTSSDSTIKAGMNNTILVPASIFTNSYFYKHEIVDGNGATK